MSNQRYMMRGVSASKEDVHNAIKNIDKGIFPKAFCKIIPDILGGDPEYCNIMHADGAGTKSSLAYMYWKEHVLPALGRRLRQHLRRAVHPDHLVPPGSQLPGEGTRPAGQVQHRPSGQPLPPEVGLQIVRPGGIAHIGGQLVVAARQKIIAAHHAAPSDGGGWCGSRPPHSADSGSPG